MALREARPFAEELRGFDPAVSLFGTLAFAKLRHLLKSINTLAASRKAHTRLAVDIGGTFTDVAAFDEKSGRLLLGKALSTPARLVDGITHGVVKAAVRYADASIFMHGSTIAINTLLERKGARSALVKTEGFRDVYEIGRINRPDSYNLYFRKHVPLVPRSLAF